MHYLDLSQQFLQADGSISQEIMPDLLHLSPGPSPLGRGSGTQIARAWSIASSPINSSLDLTRIRKVFVLLNIYTIPVTPFMQNARVLHESHSGAAIIVDPGGDLDQILSVVEQLQPPEISVLLTHAHIDHAGATAACLEVLRREYSSGVRLLAHPEPLLRASVGQQAQLFGLPSHEYRDAPDPDVTLADNDRFLLGDCTAEVYWTPGHAPDHLSVYFPVER